MKLKGAIGLLLFLATACNRGAATPVGTSTPQNDGVAPQTVGWSPVKIAVVPTKVKPGSTFEVRSTFVPGADPPATWTAAHAYLDRKVDGKWQVAWFFDTRGQSVVMGPGLQGALAYTNEGHNPALPLTFTLKPAPPPGEYRLRLSVTDGSAERLTPGGPLPSYWSVASIEVLPS